MLLFQIFLFSLKSRIFAVIILAYKEQKKKMSAEIELMQCLRAIYEKANVAVPIKAYEFGHSGINFILTAKIPPHNDAKETTTYVARLPQTAGTFKDRLELAELMHNHLKSHKPLSGITPYKQQIDLKAVESIIKYTFTTDRGKEHIRIAMTVPTQTGCEDHRMLALVGDAEIRNFFTKRLFLAKTPVDDVGTLTQKVAKYVCNNKMSSIAVLSGLRQHMIVPLYIHEAEKAMATTFEAVLGAVWMDGGDAGDVITHMYQI